MSLPLRLCRWDGVRGAVFDGGDGQGRVAARGPVQLGSDVEILHPWIIQPRRSSLAHQVVCGTDFKIRSSGPCPAVDMAAFPAGNALAAHPQLPAPMTQGRPLSLALSGSPGDQDDQVPKLPRPRGVRIQQDSISKTTGCIILRWLCSIILCLPGDSLFLGGAAILPNQQELVLRVADRAAVIFPKQQPVARAAASLLVARVFHHSASGSPAGRPKILRGPHSRC